MRLLKSVRRGWPVMSCTVSASQFRWYLDNYASSSSVRKAVVPEDTWGVARHGGNGCQFLQNTVYVIERVASPINRYRCSKYVTITVFFHNCVAKTAAEYHLQLLEIIDEVVAAKTMTSALSPLILQYSE